IVDRRKRRTRESDHVYLNAIRREIFLKRGDKFLRVAMIESAVKEVYADDAQTLLLIDVCFIKHPDVDNDLARFAAVLLLKADAQPTMRFVKLFKAASCNRVGKNKKSPLISELLIQPLDQ